MSLQNVQISVLAPDLADGETVHVVGDFEVLGNWAGDEALPLALDRKNEDNNVCWTAIIEIPVPATFRCRIIVKNGRRVVRWESKPKGRKFTIPAFGDDAPQVYCLPTWTLGQFPPKPGRSRGMCMDQGLLDFHTGSEVHIVLGSLASTPSILFQTPIADFASIVITARISDDRPVRSWSEAGLTIFKFNVYSADPNTSENTDDLNAVIVLTLRHSQNNNIVAIATLSFASFVKANKRSAVQTTRDHFVCPLIAPYAPLSHNPRSAEIPIVVVGTISGEFQVYHPFFHLTNSLQRTYRSYWSTRETHNIGYRGLGKSFQKVVGEKSSSVKENTLCSFSNTGLGGVGWVEVNTQLSKDRIPIVYHELFVGTQARCRASSATPEQIIRVGVHELSLIELKTVRITHAEAPKPKVDEDPRPSTRRSSIMKLFKMMGKESPEASTDKKALSGKMRELIDQHVRTLKHAKQQQQQQQQQQKQSPQSAQPSPSQPMNQLPLMGRSPVVSTGSFSDDDQPADVDTGDLPPPATDTQGRGSHRHAHSTQDQNISVGVAPSPRSLVSGNPLTLISSASPAGSLNLVPLSMGFGFLGGSSASSTPAGASANRNPNPSVSPASTLNMAPLSMGLNFLSGPGPAQARGENKFGEDEFCATFMSSMPTLEEILAALPLGMGITIEVKYPCDPQEEQLSFDPEFEINQYVDEILTVVFDCTPRGRRVILTSFHPDICTALHLKQCRFPVLFLTNAGQPCHFSDLRMNTLEHGCGYAIHEALQGVMCNAEPLLVSCASLSSVSPRSSSATANDTSKECESEPSHVGKDHVTALKDANLVVFTWGTPNNLIHSIELQQKWGVDAVVCDSVINTVALRRLVNSVSEGSQGSKQPDTIALSQLSQVQVVALLHSLGLAHLEHTVRNNTISGAHLQACNTEHELAALFGDPATPKDIDFVNDMKKIWMLLECSQDENGVSRINSNAIQTSET